MVNEEVPQESEEDLIQNYEEYLSGKKMMEMKIEETKESGE